MKIDVSDLFDDLYDVAALARAKFELSQTIEPDRYCSEWQRFCDILSDTLFLPACASRVFGLTHNKISNEQVKSRIITEKLSTNGKCKFLLHPGSKMTMDHRIGDKISTWCSGWASYLPVR